MKVIYIKKIGRKPGKKILATILYTLILSIFWLYISNVNYFFYADITWTSKPLDKATLIAKLDDIRDTSTAWPVKYVTNWWNIDNYEKTKWTEWEKLEDDKKILFPNKVSDTIEKYRFIAPQSIYEYISNPYERQKLLLYKRLLTTLWTASYSCPKDNCQLWNHDSWTHAGIDIISSVKTPVYSMSNWIILNLKTCEPDKCEWFGNYMVIATNFKWDVIAWFYGHLDSINPNLKIWDTVKRWDLIAFIGNSWNSTAPHLHFQINKIWKSENLKNINIEEQLYQGWYHNLEWVKQKTYDPIEFIESNWQVTNDSFDQITSNNDTVKPVDTPVETTQKNENIVTKEPEQTKEDLVEEVSKELKNYQEEQKMAAAPVEDFRIKTIKLSKIDNKLTVWDTIKATIETTWKAWIITINTNNETLTPSTYIINPGQTKYEINIKWSKIWNGKLTFNDWQNNKVYYLSVYPNSIEAFWLKIEWPSTIYRSVSQKYTIYPIDKLGNKIDTMLEWEFKVILQDKDNTKQTVVKTFYNKDPKTVFDLDLYSSDIEFSKLKVSFEWKNKSYLASKTINTDLFLDYSINDNYWIWLNYLLNKWIVKWSKWFVSPNNDLLRADLVYMVVKQKYDTVWTNEMKSYIKSKWKFFKDIKGTERYAPYFYLGFKDWLISWKNANPKKVATKEDLIEIYGKSFSIYYDQLFNNWLDIKNTDRIKIYADAAKKYNLYPFEDLSSFNWKQTVNRIKAFESLYRYMNIKSAIKTSVNNGNNINKTPSSPTTNKIYNKWYESQLEDAMTKMISF